MVELFSKWIIGCLIFSLPSGLQQVSHTSDSVAGVVPGTRVFEETASWRDQAAGTDLYVSYWKPYPPRPGGPMVTTRQWTMSVAGQEATVSETSQFLGSEQRVLVCHLKFKHPEASAMIYSRSLNEEDFRQVLSGLSLQSDKD